MTIWFGFVALWCLTVIGFTVVALVMALVEGQGIPWRGLLMCVLFIGVGLGMMIFAATLTGPSTSTWKAEVERISTHIRQTLEGRDS